MAAGIPGMWNQAANNPAEVRTRPMAEANSANGSSASIAANDFLTLLVTEMKNQDPTATTDPNEYVNQLVQVNSLQQLISINETLQKSFAPIADVAHGASPGRLPSASSMANDSMEWRSSNAGVSGKTPVSTNAGISPGAAQRIATALTR